MQDTKAFAPFYRVSTATAAGGLMPSVTVAATAGGATASTAIAGGDTCQQLQIANTSATAWAYVQLGVIRDALTVAAAAVASSFPVPPNSSKVISVDPDVNGASVIMGAGSANVIFTRGGGV